MRRIKKIVSWLPVFRTILREYQDIAWRNRQDALAKQSKELDVERVRLAQLIAALTRVSIERPQNKGRALRLFIEFDEYMVSHVVAPGSQDAVRYLARHVGYAIEKEMLSINFARITDREPVTWSPSADRPPYSLVE